MPTSAEDPVGAKRQRDSLPPTDWDKDSEWLPLWLMGPVLAVSTVVALIGVCYIATYMGIF